MFLGALWKNQRPVKNMAYEFMMQIGMKIFLKMMLPFRFIAWLLCKFLDVNSCTVFVIKAMTDSKLVYIIDYYNIHEKKI